VSAWKRSSASYWCGLSNKFNWNQTQAARYLDISRRTLIYRMEKHGLRREGEPE